VRLLLVEDDIVLGDGLQAGLMQQGYAVDWMANGTTAYQALRSHQYEIVVMDLGLPGKSGLEILKSMRKRKDHTPVLILTARDMVYDRITGLDSGADDYVTKPFDLNEICARLRALERRFHGRSEPLIEHQDVVLDPAANTLTYQGQPVQLTGREYNLLKFLMENRGRVVSRSQIEETLYTWNEEVESNAVEVHIHHLRQKLYPELIRTVRSVGYVIDQRT